MDPITQTRVVGYLRTMTLDRRYINTVDLADGPVPVHLEGSTSIEFGTAVVRLEGDEIIADLTLTAQPPTGVPMISLDVPRENVRPHFIGGQIVRVNVSGRVVGILWTRKPAWNMLRGRRG